MRSVQQCARDAPVRSPAQNTSTDIPPVFDIHVHAMDAGAREVIEAIAAAHDSA